MAYYYFDLETTGIDPEKDKIITIQWQKLAARTGNPIGDLKVFQEWVTSEEAILSAAIPQLSTKTPWDFVLIGNNLFFDFTFLEAKARQYRLGDLSLMHWYHQPWLDLRTTLILMNQGRFKNFDQIIRPQRQKKRLDIPRLYRDHEYEKILQHIQEKAATIIHAYQFLLANLSDLTPALRGYLQEPLVPPSKSAEK